MHICVYIHVYLFVCAYICVCIWICTYLCVCLCVYIRGCTCNTPNGQGSDVILLESIFSYNVSFWDSIQGHRFSSKCLAHGAISAAPILVLLQKSYTRYRDTYKFCIGVHVLEVFPGWYIVEKLGSPSQILHPLMAGLWLSGGRGSTQRGPGIFVIETASVST